MIANLARIGMLLIGSSIVIAAQIPTALPSPLTFGRGDIIVSLETGPVQWWHADGTFNRTLASSVVGTGEGMAFDASGNLYVTRWSVDPNGLSHDTVEVFDTFGVSQGTVGSGYCGPHAILFDAVGNAYVGQAGCGGPILKFAPGQQTPVSFPVAQDNQGSFWIDLAADGCTMFYTSYGLNVKRFNVCTGRQLSNFNVAPAPGGVAHDVRVLPDRGVIVASGEMIARLNASGALVQTYAVPGESLYYAGLDLVGDGSFWAADYETSNIHRFDLATGVLLDSFNTGTPPHTAVAVRVMK